jgi:hypothetical protein
VLEEGFINIADELKYNGNYKFLEEGEIVKSWKEAEAARIMYTHLVTAFETNEKIKLCCDMYSLLNEYKELEETFRWYQFSHREPVTK